MQLHYSTPSFYAAIRNHEVRVSSHAGRRSFTPDFTKPLQSGTSVASSSSAPANDGAGTSADSALNPAAES